MAALCTPLSSPPPTCHPSGPREKVRRGVDLLVVRGATGAQKVAAGLLQVPVKHLQHFVTLASWPKTQPKELLHLRGSRARL